MTTTARATMTAAKTAAAVVGGGGSGGLSIVPPSKSPEAESETPPRIQPSKPLSFSNGVLKRHAPAVVLYKECLKNHAASLGGHALDGCGEFMPAPTATASDPTSLKCAACGCHLNFHRREPEETVNAMSAVATPLTHVIEYHPHHRHHPLPPPASNPQTAPAVATRGLRSPGSQSPPPISSSYYPGSAPHMLLALSSGGVGATTSVPDNNTPTTNNGPHHPHHHHHHHPHQQQQHHHHHHKHNHNQGQHLMNSSSLQPPSRKRFRTKFSQDQKDRMHEFAEKVGWKMQKTNEDLVNGFCNEIGVERGVFKVWMHNNKNSSAKRSTTATTTSGVVANCGTNPTDDLINNPIEDDENNGNLTGNGNSNSSISINDQSHHHVNHHNHHKHQHQQYNGGKSNETNAPTNGSSSSS